MRPRREMVILCHATCVPFAVLGVIVILKFGGLI